MGFVITNEVYEKILCAARKAAPLEACGLLGGANGLVSAFYELTNADVSNEHYRMLPEEQFAAVKDMRSKGMEMLANWHSHPETPARMSEEDLHLAYTPGLVYVIASLADPANPEIRGYKIEADRPVDVGLEIQG